MAMLQSVTAATLLYLRLRTDHLKGPNPWKVIIILEELGLPCEIEYMEFGDLKKEPYLSINPNGRTPSMEDPNTGITLWEVC